MRQLLPVVFSALAVVSYSAFAADPVKPEIGAGPHLDRSGQTSGSGESRDPVQPVPPAPPASASTGPSQPAGAADRVEDERKATESKEKMKKKPGYQEDAPSPRASHTGLVIN